MAREGRAADGQDGDEGSDGATADPPLPPYPSTLGHPLTHTVGAMRDVFGFRNRAMAERDFVRVKLLGPGDVYHLGHPDHFERVLLSDRGKFRKSEDFRIAFDGGLVAVEGDDWRRQREVLQPLFARDRLLDYVDEMVEQIRRRRRRWDAGTRIDLAAETSQLSLDVLFATLFGRELAIDGDEAIRTAADRLQHWFAPTSYPLPTWVPTPARRRFKRGKRRLRSVADRLLDSAAADPPSDPGAADDLLSLLVALRESGVAADGALSDDRLRDQVVTMIFAGHDTTSTAIAFAFYALATNPDVRERFHAEVDALDGPPTVGDLDALDVTGRVVTEALRLYPPVYTIPREAATDVTLDGYRIPEGSPTWLTVDQVHRDPRFYDDPDAFRPERWAADLRERLPDFAYAPFGGGPRRCIGRQFALIEAQLALATIGREYRLDYPVPDPDPPLIGAMTARMEPGTEFVVEER
ncbi:cytochrome P450 [Haloplanus halophilus]|uniref:cytochrome P450 n=1 Tax=Haloplanus halophilus TaxID=2949993 RepID=UPI00203FCC6A|nr:cytochrome P450 [Haloplanus sp. GDY1]